MQTLFFLFLSCSLSMGAVTFLTFNASTNPSNATISLTVSSSSVSSVYQQYTIEFWLRPLLSQTSSSSLTILKDTSDWSILYSPLDPSISVQGATGLEYCMVYPVPSNTWTHLALSYDYMYTIFSCYLNGILNSTKTTQAVAKYPASLLLGSNFYGNIYQLRAWVGVVRSDAQIYQYYRSLYAPPYPSTLLRLWNLTEEAKSTTITDSIRFTSASISSKFKKPWISDPSGSLQLCNTGYYGSSGNCASCSQLCGFCAASDRCYQTTRSYLDFGRAGNASDIIMLGSISSTLVGSLEFWFRPNGWTGNSEEIITIKNFLTVAQVLDSENIAFYDGGGTQTVTVLATPGYWTHVSWIYRTSYVQIFVNSTDYNVTNWKNGTNTIMYLGGSTSNVRFNGIISDLRFWRSAHTSSQVLSSLYTNFSSLSSDMYLFFPLNNTGNLISSTNLQSTTSKSIILSLWNTQNCTTESCLFQCAPNSFADSLGNCFACDSSCLACSGTLASDCTICPSSALRISGQNNCYTYCPSGYVQYGLACLLACPATFYNSSGVCTACLLPCVNCLSASYCTSCAVGYLLYPANVQNRCEKLCPSGQYRDSNNNCDNCDSSCAECTGSTGQDCIQCKNSQFLYKGTCVGSCSVSTYSVDASCFDCDQSCYNCTGPESSQCGLCAALYPYRDLAGICYKQCPNYVVIDTSMCEDQCPAHMYTKNMECLACDSSCEQCSGSTSSDCIQCTNFLYDGKCYDLCPQGTFSNDTSNYCYDCDVSCSSCLGNLTNCTSCSTTHPFYDANTCYTACPVYTFPPYQCVDNCNIGFIPINKICTACDSSCNDCIEIPTKCTLCVEGLNLFNRTCIETCPAGYYSSENVCFTCDNSCETCACTRSFCTSCSSNSLYLDPTQGTCLSTCILPKYMFNHTCLATCPDFYYADPYRYCQSCAEGCIECLDSNNCISCSEDYYHLAGACLGQCPGSTFPIPTNMTCGVCDSQCLECTGPSISNCTVCAGNKLVYVDDEGIGQCLSACVAGTFQQATMCMDCNFTCASCSNGATCNTCQEGYYMTKTSQCVDHCDAGEIGEGGMCIGYTNFSPSGTVDLNAMPILNLTYPLPLTLGSGRLNIYQVLNTTYSLLLSLPIATSSYSISTSLCTAVPSSVLRYGLTYSVEYTASSVLSNGGGNFRIPPGILFFATKAYALKPLVVIINNSTVATEVAKSSTFLLDASASFDPSGLYSNSPLRGAWDCQDYSANFQYYNTYYSTSFADYISMALASEVSKDLCDNWNYHSPPTAFAIDPSPYNTSNLVMRYVFTLSDVSRSSYGYIYVRVVPDQFSMVSIENTPFYRVNSDKPVQLSAGSPNIENHKGYSWTYSSAGQPPQFLTPETGSWTITIAENSLTSEVNYQFSLTYSDNISQGTAIVSITANSPPQNGVLVVNTNSGVALQDIFIFSMIGWVDLDIPLRYSFVMAKDTGNYWMQITQPQSSAQVSIILSAGSIEVVGYCYDSLGARSQTSTNLNVTSNRDLGDIIVEIDKQRTVITEVNLMIVLSYVMAFADELNYPLYDSDSVITQKSTLMQYVVAANSLGQSMYLQGDTDYLYVFTAVLGCLELLAQSPFDALIANTSLAIVQGINFSSFSAKQLIEITDGNLTITSPQGILSTDELLNISVLLSNILNNLSAFPNLFTSSVIGLISNINTVLSTGTALWEQPRNITSSSLLVTTSKSLVSSIENTVMNLTRGSISIPSLASVNQTSASVIAAHSSINPFNSSAVCLQQYILMSLGSVDLTSTIEVSNLAEPFVFSFEVTREEIAEIERQQRVVTGNSAQYWPLCSFWDFQAADWSRSGCNIYNIEEIYEYFDSSVFPEELTIQCACNHLSYFTVAFDSAKHFSQVTFMIDKKNTNVFEIGQWQKGIVIYLMVSGVIAFGILLALGFCYDKKRNQAQLILAEGSFDFFDAEKINCLLLQLDKRHIEEVSGTEGIVNSIYTIATSALYKKFSGSSSETLENEEYTLKNSYKYKSPEYFKKEQGKYREDELSTRIDAYLKTNEHIDDKDQSISGKKIFIRKTKERSRLLLENIERNKEEVSEADTFLKKYEGTRTYSESINQKLNLRVLNPHHLLSLNINPSEFYGLSLNSKNELTPVPSNITGENYCNFYLAAKMIKEVDSYFKSTRIPYWSIFWLYLKKEHKYLSIFFSLHMEYSKKQIISIAFLSWFLQLFLCQICIAFLNWNYSKVYNTSGFCVWGCRYESQMLLGIICAVLPWPVVYLSKHLFSKSMLDYRSPFNEK